MTSSLYQFNPELDLVLERVIDIPPSQVWKAWTTPELIMQWFAPKPWMTVDCELDLRPGGIFSTTMRSPDGKDFPNVGCYLELVENKKIVWTSALEPGYRPSLHPFFTAILTFEDCNGGTKYTAKGLHKNAADRKTHADMGFEQGWAKCLEQLVKVVKQI